MKKNKKIFLSTFIIVLSLSLFINNFNAVEYDSSKSYHIAGSKYVLTNVSAKAQVYHKASSSTSYKAKENCSGTFDTNDCIFQWREYYNTCSASGITARCKFKSSNISNSSGYQKTITRTNSTNQWTTDDKANSFCASYKSTLSCTETRGGKDYTYDKKDVPFTSSSHGYRECTNSSYVSNKKTIDGQTYASGSYTSSCYKTVIKACKCSTSKAAYTSTDQKSLTSYAGSVKETGADSFCISPGLTWPTASTTYKVENINTSKCKTGSTKFECGLIAILETAEAKGYDYDSKILALRFWAADKGTVYFAQDGLSTENIESDSLYIKNPIYKTTVQEIAKGYTGQKGYSNLADNVIFGKNDTGAANIKNAISLYKIAASGSYEIWSPDIKISSNITPDKNGKFTFTITGKFDSSNTTAVDIKSTTSGITLKFQNSSTCKSSGNCEIVGTISGYGPDNCPSSVSFEFTYTDKRDAAKKIHLLSPSKPEVYQRFIVYDKKATATVYAGTANLNSNCNTAKCEEPTDIQYDVPDNCSQGTTGTIKDPTLNCIITSRVYNRASGKYYLQASSRADTLAKNYDYTTLYMNSTNGQSGFCEMQCRETITLKFFGHAHSNSTRFYSYGSVIETIIGDRECASEIDYKKWTDAYNKANDAVRTTWNTYKYWENVHVYTTPKPSTISCHAGGGCSSCYCCCCGYDEYGRCTSHSCCCVTLCSPYCSITQIKLTWPSKAYTVTNSSGSTSTAYSSETDGYVSCSASNCGQWSSCTGRDGNPNAWAGAYSSAKSAYGNAVRARESLIADLQNCNLYSSYTLNTLDNPESGSKYTRSNTTTAYYNATTGYDFDPTITYDYEDEYNSLISIGSRTSLTKKTQASYCVGCDKTDGLGASTTEEIDYWTCSGNQTGARCTKQKITVPKNTLAYITAQKKTTFSQDTMFAASVPDGDVIVANGSSDYLQLSQDYIFPLELNKLSGVYEVESTYDKLGDANRKTAVKINGGDYDCDINVDNLITIPIGYYYRTIDPTEPFPNGVHTGTWSTTRARNLTSQIKKAGMNIYTDGTPQYEFILSPGNLNNIKDYNNMLDGEGLGYHNFDLSCTCRPGICDCTSDFLENLSSYGAYSDFVTRFYRDGVEQ